MATYDAAAYQPQTNDVIYAAALFTHDVPGRMLTGTEKLAQRFLLELLTDPGSMQFRPNRGGGLVELLRSGIVNENDIYHAFYIALIRVASNLTSEETDDDPEDEKYGSALLSQITLLTGEYRLTIGLQSQAGTAINLRWPVSIDAQTVHDFSELEIEE